MFESLQQQRGTSSKDKRRLVVSLGAALAIGAVAFGGSQFFSGAPPVRPSVPAKHAPTGPTRALDVTPLADVAKGVSPAAFDVPALRHVLAEVTRDRWARRLAPKARAELAKEEARARLKGEPVIEASRPLDDEGVELEETAHVAALPAADAGKYVECKGVVASFDPAGFVLSELGAARRVWALELQGADGTHVVFLDSEVPRDRRPLPASMGPTIPADGGDGAGGADTTRPAAPTQRPAFDVGDLVRARGYVLQQRVGSIGPITLAAATPVLVGRDYRPAVKPPPSPKSPTDVATEDVQDRAVEDTWDVDAFAHFATMYWAQSRGHDALWADLRARSLPYTRWQRTQFIKWSGEVKNSAKAGPDPRTWTNESRGKVFLLSGILVAADLEDWDTVPDNAYDVGRRWVYRLVCDDYGQDAMIRFDSPFPLEAFPGVTKPDTKNPQRVRIYGVFLRNHSYVPLGSMDPEVQAKFRADPEHYVTVPAFVALHIAPDPLGESAPLYENAFFWSWVIILVLALVFFGVMRGVDRREEGRMRSREARIRHAIPGAYNPRPDGNSASAAESASPAGPAAQADKAT
jgi:hypothetical protein